MKSSVLHIIFFFWLIQYILSIDHFFLWQSESGHDVCSGKHGSSVAAEDQQSILERSRQQERASWAG